MDGWTGKLLRVDLTRGKLQVEEWNLELAQAVLGGRGLAGVIFAGEVGPDVDPLGPANKLVVMCGPLTGTATPGGCVAAAVSKSPLTGGLACGLIKGHFASELKHAGLDGLIIEGRSRHPVYLCLLPGQVRLLPAGQLWGRTTGNTETLIRADMKDPWRSRELRVLSIGPAGERQAALSSLVADGCLVPGAAGLGAVLGAKNLKAIAVRGTAGVTVANGGLFLRVVSTLLNKLATAPLTAEALPRHGTPFLFRHLAAHGALPEGWFGEAASEWRGDLSPQRLAGYRRAARACFACPIGCLQLTELQGTLLSGEGKGPEYDALAQFGVVCGVDSLPAILSANYRCTEGGLDPVAAGGTVACAMSLYRDGLLTKADTGCELGFGEAEALLGCLGLMARGEGFGSLLAQGSRRLCQELGCPERFLGVRGLELPPYEVRAIQGLGLHFATAGGGPLDLSGLTLIDEVLGVHRPADALESEGKPALVKLHQDACAALDSLGVCVLPLMGLWVGNLVPAFRSVTGMELGAEELLAAGERAVNLERLWNLAAGIPGSADRLPQKLLTEPLEAGPAKGRVCELDKMLPEYYELRGWDASGKPAAARLDGLGLRL